MNKVNVLNDHRISILIKNFYLRNIDEMTLADNYFNYGLYSAASGIYCSYLNQHYKDLDTIKKSECLVKLANCYLNQLDDQPSEWQLTLIYSLLKYSIIYNPKNFLSHYFLAVTYIKQGNPKDACFEYEYIIMNLNSLEFIDYLKEYHIEFIINSIYNTYLISDRFKTVKYDSFNKKVLDFLSNHINEISKDNYKLIMNKMIENEQRISDYEFNEIMHFQ